MTEVVELYKRPLKPRKRLVRKSLKRKRPKTPLKKLRAQLWQLCKEIIRKKYGNRCFTCDALGLTGSNWHTGHFIPRSICGLYLRYDLRNLRPQCYRCNISLSGNGATFYRNLVVQEGQAYIDAIFADKKHDLKETIGFYQQKIAEYQQILKELC